MWKIRPYFLQSSHLRHSRFESKQNVENLKHEPEMPIPWKSGAL